MRQGVVMPRRPGRPRNPNPVARIDAHIYIRTEAYKIGCRLADHLGVSFSVLAERAIMALAALEVKAKMEG